jgi:hypothetical protein
MEEILNPSAEPTTALRLVFTGGGLSPALASYIL